jgi:hypothetical protein
VGKRAKERDRWKMREKIVKKLFVM